MRISKVILAWDGNRDFSGFWEVAAPLWHWLGITPVMVVVSGEEIDFDHSLGEVRYESPRSGVSLAEQANWLRYVHAAMEGDEIVILGDLDMLPLSRWYFVDQLAGVPDTAYVHLNPCEAREYQYRFPTCYHVAQGARYLDVLFGGRIPEDPFSVLPRLTWQAEEEYATNRLVRRSDITTIRRDGGVSGHRICRTLNWNTYDLGAVWYDAHCPRPFATHRKEIERVAALAH